MSRFRRLTMTVRATSVSKQRGVRLAHRSGLGRRAEHPRPRLVARSQNLPQTFPQGTRHHNGRAMQNKRDRAERTLGLSTRGSFDLRQPIRVGGVLVRNARQFDGAELSPESQTKANECGIRHDNTQARTPATRLDGPNGRPTSRSSNSRRSSSFLPLSRVRATVTTSLTSRSAVAPRSVVCHRVLTPVCEAHGDKGRWSAAQGTPTLNTNVTKSLWARGSIVIRQAKGSRHPPLDDGADAL